VPAVDLFQPVERGDVRMVQLGEEPRFACEPLETLVVPRKLLRKDFDGDVPLELGVAGAVDDSMPPAPISSRMV